MGITLYIYENLVIICVWDEPGARWIRWLKVCGAADTCEKGEGPSLSIACPSGLAVFSRGMDSDQPTKMEAELFGTTSLRRILGHRWHDYMSNDLVLSEAGLKQATCIVRER